MAIEGAGTAGASARREYEKRRARDEATIRDRWGRFGGIAVALSDEKQSTRAWSTGALGEGVVGARLDRIASDDIRILHDRHIPGSRANIDHIVITREAVWVVDAKHYKGKPERSVEGGLFRPRVEKLTVRGRDQTKLVDDVLGQVARVSAAVPGVPVRGVLCFVEADWPLFSGEFKVRGIDVLWPKKLAANLSRATGDLDVAATHARLADVFRPA